VFTAKPHGATILPNPIARNVEAPSRHDLADIPPAFRPLFQPARYKVYWSGRGAAKSWSFARALLIQGGEKPLRIACARETMKSIADSVHQLLTDQVRALGLEDSYTVQKASIEGVNGTRFLFLGLRHNPDAVRSLEGADILWVEEAHNVSAESWNVVIPTIRKPGSQIWVSFNPRMETDDTYRRFVLHPPPGAVVKKVSYRHNRWFSEELRIELEHLKRTDYKAYLNVWEGECQSAAEGAIYQAEIEQAEREGRIAEVPAEMERPVDTYWDLGFGDATAIWFVQTLPSGAHRLIDYLENRGKTIAWYVVQLQQKPYIYGTDWVPHDAVDAIIHSRLAGDKSKSVEQVLRGAGRKVRVAPKLHIHAGLDAARTVFSRCWFDRDACREGLAALRHYQWGDASATGIERRAPLHNWASHGSDAFRTFAVCAKAPVAEEEERAGWRGPPRVGGGRYGWLG
jgi:phage terminase large subunit